MKNWLNEFWQEHKIRSLFTLFVFVAIAAASYVGQDYKLVKITQQFKADSIQVENNAQAKIVDTVQVKNREIKSLVAVMKEAPRQVRKVEKADTLLIIKLTPAKDSSRKDITQQ